MLIIRSHRRSLNADIEMFGNLIALTALAGQASADNVPQSFRGKSIVCCAGESRSLNLPSTSYFQSK